MRDKHILSDKDLKAIEEIDIEAGKLITDCLLETHSIDRKQVAQTLTQYQNMVYNLQQKIQNNE